MNSELTKTRNALLRFSTPLTLLLMMIIMTLLTDRFLTLDNLFTVLRQVSTNGIIAFGMTLVIITGGIDLSVGSIVAFCGTIACGFIENGLGILLSIVASILCGVIFGLFNGLLVTKAKMPPFIVTLASMQIIRGCAYLYSGGMPIRAIDIAFNRIGNGYLWVFPIPVIIFFVVGICFYILLHKTTFGIHILSVGGNRNCAVFSGINADRVQLIVFAISGVCAAISGIILAARMYSGQPTSGDGAEMDAVASAVLGGTAFTGGKGSILGTFIGILIIGCMNNGLNILNVSSYYQLLIKGVIILLAIYLERFKDNM